MQNKHIKENQFNISSFLWKSIKPYKFYIFLILQASIIGGIFMPINQYIVKTIIDALTQHPHFHFHELEVPVLLFIGSYIFLEISWRLSNLGEYKSIPLIRTKLTHNAYSSVTKNTYSFFQNNLSGTLSSKINHIEYGLNKIFENIRMNILHPIVMIVSTMFFLCSASILFVYVMLAFYAVYFPTVYFISRNINLTSSDYARKRQSISGLINDSISNIVSVFIFSNREREMSSLKKFQSKLINSEKKLITQEFYLHLIVGVMYVAVSSAVLLLLISLKSKGEITIGDFVMVLGLMGHMLQVAYVLVMNLKILVRDIGELRECFSIFDPDFQAETRSKLKILKINSPTIEIKDLHFGYEDKLLFEHLNLKINSGEKIGIIGHSGAGKSTLVNLILKHYKPISGNILIDNHDINKFTQESVRKLISVIPQDTTLFHRSIKENISYGKDEATDREIIHACKKAHLHDFIESLPNKYETIVGEKGLKLSGGQRQRIAIARAILKDAPILILDEATSSLDSQTETQIQQSLDLLMTQKRKTIIAIAHRLSTLRNMNRIIVLEGGKIIESGNHTDLLQKTESHYSQLWHLQMSQFNLPEQVQPS